MAEVAMNAWIADLPWRLTQWPKLPAASKSIPVAPGRGTCVLFSAESQLGPLQEYAREVLLEGRRFLLLELPGPAVRGPETKALRIGVKQPLQLEYQPASTFQWRQGPETVLENGHVQYDGFIDDALARMQEVEEFAAARGKRSASGHVWWPVLLNDFMDYRDADEAGRGLIVGLAERMPLYLRDIVAGPKRVLKRFREPSRLDRIQELDVHCLLDYAQRPGRSASEKAGQKQRLLAVIRRESFDTLENRVTLDFCRRSRQAVRSYKEQNAKFAAFDPEKQTGSKRLAKVLNYGKYCEAYLSDFVWDGVSVLAEPCRTPNYALAQNPLYVEVWREYLKLLRYANLREAAWRWPRLAWADIVRAFVGDGIRAEMRDTNALRLAKRPLRNGRTIERGSWFRDGGCEGDWLVRRDGVALGCLYLIERSDIRRFSATPHLELANADFYICWLPVGTNLSFYLPIWAMVGDLSWKDLDEAARTRTAWAHDLGDCLRALQGRLPADVRLAGGAIIRPDWMSGRPGGTRTTLKMADQGSLPIWFIETHACGNWGDQVGEIRTIVQGLVSHAARN